MNIRKTIFLSFCTIVFVCFTFFQINAENDVLWTDGNIKFTYNAKGSILTISGEGKTDDYTTILPGPFSPIYKNENIKHIVVEEGITYIGNSLFADCNNIESVEFPVSLNGIGTSAFDGCYKIKCIEFPESIKHIDPPGFSDSTNVLCNLNEIRFYGNTPEIVLNGLFENFKGTVYFPNNNPTWTPEVMEEYGSAYGADITWIAWDAPEITKAENKFTDVVTDAWYLEGIQYVYENGTMSGMGNAKFAPSGNVTREQLMQVFFAMEGLDKADYEGETGFVDVSEGRWYSPSVKWAKAEGITDGIKEDIFGIGRYVTREQLATFIMNYVEYKNGDVTADVDLTSFSDVDDISDWAVAGMEFCVEKGIINGRADGTLDPRTPANRAELAQILKQYATL